jgi:hypothetical protein
MKKNLILFFASSLLSCQNIPKAPPLREVGMQAQYKPIEMLQMDETVDLQQVKSILLPKGYERIPQSDNSFAAYLRVLS